MSDYKDLIKKIDNLKDHCENMARDKDAEEVWKQDVEALQEAMDIVSDYEKVTVNEARMSQHYETREKPIHKSGVWVCPACGKKIPYHHSYCHWCGKKVGWNIR